MPDELELFFDPVCPFCWVTSRWAEEACAQTGTRLTYRPIALRLLNPDTPLDEPMGAVHQQGLRLLRVAVAVEAAHGPAAVARLYGALGAEIHEQPVETADGFGQIARIQADRPTDVGAVLRAVDLPAALQDAMDDDAHDQAIAASTRTALERAGEDVGTPVLTFDPPLGPSVFGPVIDAPPEAEEAGALLEATYALARHRGFTELKRGGGVLPRVAALATLR